MSVEETAEVLGISPVTVMREWSTAKGWLLRAMSPEAQENYSGLNDRDRREIPP
jgi:uncharacterized protein YjcR